MDSEWQNLKVSIDLEFILSTKGKFASSKLSINRDTWPVYESVVMIDIRKSAFTYNEGINEAWSANNQGQYREG